MPAGSPAAEGSRATLDYQHYNEGRRDLASREYAELDLKAIEVDSLALAMHHAFHDLFALDLHYMQDTWAGATPVLSLPQAAISDQIYTGASIPQSYAVDRDGQPVTVNYDDFTGSGFAHNRDGRGVHLMGSASAETRRQVDATLGYAGGTHTLRIGGGVSEEPDYHSAFLSIGGTRDFNSKRTTVEWGASYTHANIDASLEANSAADWGAYAARIRLQDGQRTLFGQRRDTALTLGVTHIIDKHSLFALGAGYARASGYLGNPYKAVMLAFDDSSQLPDASGLRTVVLRGVLEQRPDQRHQWTLSARHVGYVERFDAALHADYRFFRDDWGIAAHTFEFAWHQPLGFGFSLIPGLRYYRQSRAEFYRAYFVFNQAMPVMPGPVIGGALPEIDHARLARHTFASDTRLSDFGFLAGQLAFKHELARGMTFEIGTEYGVHAGWLKLGGDGEGSFADYDSYFVYGSLALDLAAPALARAARREGHAVLLPRATPAGVRYAERLATAGDFAFGYRYEYGLTGGGLRRGSDDVSRREARANGCRDAPCVLLPVDINTHVSLLDLRYALSSRSTLMLATRFLSTDLDQSAVAARGAFEQDSSGGLGDSEVTWLHGLIDHQRYDFSLALGFSAPTGSIHSRLGDSRAFAPYALQLGSGTWDFVPTLTFADDHATWGWGAQATGRLRLESRNEVGYGLGDRIEASAWLSARLCAWLTASVRGLLSAASRIDGEYDARLAPHLVGYRYRGTEAVPVYSFDRAVHAHASPLDDPGAYGGLDFDLGFGLSSLIRNGPLAGNRIAFEWLQPMLNHSNGYQPDRDGRLFLTWELGF